MSERSHIYNGRFLQNLSNWTAAGGAAYSAGDGDEHYGVAVLPTGGGSVEQDFTVNAARLYTLHLSVKAVGASLTAGQATIVITDGDGNAVKTISLTGTADTWTDNDQTIGLASGTTYNLQLVNNTAAGDVKVDDVWLWYVPKTRAELATLVNRQLDSLATDASLTTTPSAGQTEGSYTDAIDAGLRNIGAINPETDQPDIRYLESSSLDAALQLIESAMLDRLQRRYLLLVDIDAGDRSEKLSQIAAAIARISGNGSSSGGGRKVIVRKLSHQAEDFNL